MTLLGVPRDRLAQNGMNVLPPYVISDEDRTWIRDAFDAVLSSCSNVTDSVWPLMRDLTAGALRDRAKA